MFPTVFGDMGAARRADPRREILVVGAGSAIRMVSPALAWSSACCSEAKAVRKLRPSEVTLFSLELTYQIIACIRQVNRREDNPRRQQA